MERQRDCETCPCPDRGTRRLIRQSRNESPTVFRIRIDRRTTMKWFYDLKLSAKLLSGFCIMAIVAGVIGYVGITNIGAVATADRELYENITVPTADLGNLGKYFQQVRVVMRDAILADNQADYQKQAEKIKQLTGDITQSAANFEKAVANPEVKAASENFAAGRKDFLPLRD